VDTQTSPSGTGLARVNLHLDEVTGTDHGGPRRGTGEDHVAGLERGQPGDVGDDVGEGEEQVVAADRLLRELAVDPGPQANPLRVDRPGVEQPRPEGGIPVDALGPDVGPAVGVPQVVDAEVVGRGHPAHVLPGVRGGHPARPGADDERDLALERQELAPRRAEHRVAVGREGAWRLEEVRGPQGQAAALHRPAAVAQVHGDDLRRLLIHHEDRI
jgi:hypothetical protein